MSPIAAAVAGFGVRVQEVPFQGRGAGGVEGGGFVDHDLGVPPRDRPCFEGCQGPGQGGGQGVGLRQQGTGGPAAEGQEAADFRGDSHFLSLHGCVGRSGRPRGLGVRPCSVDH